MKLEQCCSWRPTEKQQDGHVHLDYLHPHIVVTRITYPEKSVIMFFTASHCDLHCSSGVHPLSSLTYELINSCHLVKLLVFFCHS